MNLPGPQRLRSRSLHVFLSVVRVALRLLLRVLSLALSLLCLLLSVLRVLARLVLADLLVVAGSILRLANIVGALLLAVFVLWAEEVGNGLEEVGCDLELGGHESHDGGGDAGTAVVVLGGFVVLVCGERRVSWCWKRVSTKGSSSYLK